MLLLNADTVKQRRAAFAYLKTLPGVVEGSGALKHRFLPSKLSAVIQAVARHVLGSNEEIPLPLGLLIDTKGMIQIMTVGRVGADLLMDGHTQVQKLTTNPARRSLSGGQYYFLMPRDLNQLASLLDGVDATFYRRLASQQQK